MLPSDPPAVGCEAARIEEHVLTGTQSVGGDAVLRCDDGRAVPARRGPGGSGDRQPGDSCAAGQRSGDGPYAHDGSSPVGTAALGDAAMACAGQARGDRQHNEDRVGTNTTGADFVSAISLSAMIRGSRPDAGSAPAGGQGRRDQCGVHGRRRQGSVRAADGTGVVEEAGHAQSDAATRRRDTSGEAGTGREHGTHRGAVPPAPGAAGSSSGANLIVILTALTDDMPAA